jgi:hypothetical protein
MHAAHDIGWMVLGHHADYAPTHPLQHLQPPSVSDEPPSSQTLDRLVTTYGPGRDLRALTQAIFNDQEFTI